MTLHGRFSAATTAASLDLSVIVAADGDGAGLVDLVDAYLAALQDRGESFELLLIHDSASAGLRHAAETLATRPGVKTIAPRPWVGLDEAIADGVRHAKGLVLLTLPAWPEIQTAEIGRLIDAVGPETDLATGRCVATRLSPVQKTRIALAHRMVRLLFGQKLEDIFCRSRAGHREVFRKAADFGMRQHFLPLVALSEGYRVREIDVAPAPDAVQPALRRLRAGSHVAALVDMLSLYVALNFLKRPLRFFGSVGLPLMAIGAVTTAWLVASRLLLGTPLADRPALVFAVMMLVLGIQIIALGLVGEIVIFASSRRMRGYEIEKILRGRVPDEEN
ncbi:hypothetical protein OCH239_17395 [Roseivivax halodurans JCM 10272]|uniref:Glycosyltransferase 2-like domain-containing protein n=1 Tax=Roseivivax halodurans JCM 10272 TaxID=1449350 RepID=X7EC95_9RHOB|nr:hypothetical protein [Roseivivax halodurans]ETX12743.1 hypothetical protein OCH239_17395 [Roseivivax halodurans JCM 10272]